MSYRFYRTLPWLKIPLLRDTIMVPFSDCEEAFLLTNIRNIINVWSRGSGQASLNFCVRNGQAELNLSYQLGHPEESHLPPQPPHHHQDQPHVRQLRRKSQRRRLRDNLRAAKFQAARAAIRPAISSIPTLTTAVQTNSSGAVTSTAAVSTSSTSSLSSSCPEPSASIHGAPTPQHHVQPCSLHPHPAGWDVHHLQHHLRAGKKLKMSARGNLESYSSS